MNVRTKRLQSLTLVMLGVAILALASATPSGAIDLPPIGPRINGLQSNQVIDLQALRNRQQRQDFQQQQQRLREDDRNAVTRQRLDLTVPTIRKRCQVQVYGDRYVTNCD